MILLIGRYMINTNNINYIATESEKLVNIFFTGQDIPLILHNDDAASFTRLYGEYIDSLSQ